MFFKKPKEEETVSCETCKHLIRKADAQVVERKFSGYSAYYSPERFYYCPAHKKPYESTVSSPRVTHYYLALEVSEDGTPIGYVKKVEEKKTDKK